MSYVIPTATLTSFVRSSCSFSKRLESACPSSRNRSVRFCLRGFMCTGPSHGVSWSTSENWFRTVNMAFNVQPSYSSRVKLSASYFLEDISPSSRSTSPRTFCTNSLPRPWPQLKETLKMERKNEDTTTPRPRSLWWASTMDICWLGRAALNLPSTLEC